MSDTETEVEEPKKEKLSSAERVRRMNEAKKAKREAEAAAQAKLDAADDSSALFVLAARHTCTCGEVVAKKRGGTMYHCMRILTGNKPTSVCQKNMPEKDEKGNWMIYSKENVPPEKKVDEDGVVELLD